MTDYKRAVNVSASMSTASPTTTSTPVRIRPDAHARLRQIAARHRITVIDAIELAIASFAELPVEERRALIDGEPRRSRRSKSK